MLSLLKICQEQGRHVFVLRADKGKNAFLFKSSQTSKLVSGIIVDDQALLTLKLLKIVFRYFGKPLSSLDLFEEFFEYARLDRIAR